MPLYYAYPLWYDKKNERGEGEMENKKPRYKVVNGYTGVILAAILLAVFIAVTLWLYSQNNGAFLFTAGLSIFVLIAVLMGLYHSVFFEVSFYDNGIYFQSNHKNGRFYEYGEMQEVWKSKGLENGGVTREYYNIKLADGQVLRYLAYPKDAKGFAYLKRKVAQSPRQEIKQYTISNRALGSGGFVLVTVAWLILLVFQVGLLTSPDVPTIAVLPGLIVGVAAYGWSVVYLMCFQVVIKAEGFWLQTTPFNKTYYAYTDIGSWETRLKIYRRHKKSNTYRYFFYFQEKNGKRRRFAYNQSLFEHEIDVLAKRIDGANSKP